MIGFTFCGKHSYDDYGLYVRSKSRPVLPSRRKRQLEIPGRSGVYDFSGDDYDQRIVELECFLDANAIPGMRLRVREIAAWLSERGKLTFDDEPTLSYRAALYTAVSLEQVLSTGLFTLVFECAPFAEGRTITTTADITHSGQVVAIPYAGTRRASCRMVLKNTGFFSAYGPQLLVRKGK